VVIAIVLAVLVLAALVGAYTILGNSYAADRLDSARQAITDTNRIDFATVLAQIDGGFDPSTLRDPYSFSRAVTNFADDVKNQQPQLAAEARELHTAQDGLSTMAWLTLFNRTALGEESGRTAHALKAIGDAESINADFESDAQFFTAYATVLVDYGDLQTLATDRDFTGAVGKLESVKTDLLRVIPLAGAPGLASGVGDYLVDFQAVLTDDSAVLNAYAYADITAYKVAQAALLADYGKWAKVDTTMFDSSMHSFFTSRIGAYYQELQQASD
jgi:hypothetical protein